MMKEIKMKKTDYHQKKLELNKQTVSNLTDHQLNEIKAGQQPACWENLWTLYYCDIVWTD
jgi:hypothetical protein